MTINVKFCIKKELIEQNPHNFQYFFDEDKICDNSHEEDSSFDIITTKEDFKKRVKMVPLNSFYQKTLYLKLYSIPKKYIQPYTDKLCRPRSTLHHGQLKLFLSTLFFLTNYVDYTDNNVIVIYAGAAHGFNTGLNLYPKSILKWILIDPSKNWDTRLKSISNIQILQTFFTDELATSLKEEHSDCDIVFISDIRLDTKEESIERDNEDQLRWVNILKPISYCLKMRLPYVTPSSKKSGKYLSGDVIIQPYAQLMSTESRLMKKGSKITLKNYDYKEYEDRFFTFNRFIRCCDFRKTMDDEILGDSDYENNYDYCYDCVMFYKIIEECYFDFKASPKEIIEMMKFIDKNIVPHSSKTVLKDIEEKRVMNTYNTLKSN